MARKLSLKRIAIDKAQLNIVIAVGLTSFVVIFCAVANKTLLAQKSYQSRVITKKSEALTQTKKNNEEAEKLTKSYKAFDGEFTNLLGGDPKGSGDKDGPNSRLILDALPSKYDFPALTTSMEKLFRDNGFPIRGIVGTDDEVAQKTAEDYKNKVDMPFVVTVSTGATNGGIALQLLERSIRPIDVNTVTIKIEKGEDPKLEIGGKTYYQPIRNFNVKMETVK